MRAKDGKTGVLRLETFELSRDDVAFLYEIARAFAGFGLSVKIRKRPFFIYKGAAYYIYLIFDKKKYQSAIKGRPKRKTVILSAETIRERMDNGEIAAEIAANLGVGRATLFRYLRKAETAQKGD